MPTLAQHNCLPTPLSAGPHISKRVVLTDVPTMQRKSTTRCGPPHGTHDGRCGCVQDAGVIVGLAVLSKMRPVATSTSECPTLFSMSCPPDVPPMQMTRHVADAVDVMQPRVVERSARVV